MDRSGRPRRGLARLGNLELLGRHQIAAAIATAADFGSMVLLVELVKFSPPVATMLSVMVGALVNFTLSRRWAFRARHTGTVGSQALRYAAVSLGGAIVNAGVLALVLRAGAVAYPLARAGVSIVVGLLYTYPLHRRFVFRVVEPRENA